MTSALEYKSRASVVTSLRVAVIFKSCFSRAETGFGGVFVGCRMVNHNRLKKFFVSS